MRISLKWLQELVDINMSPQELAETLTMSGFEVEEIEDRRQWAEGVVVGRVTDCQSHPNADKLSVCQVDIGTDSPSTIVCGAANVRTGAYVLVAQVGTYLPIVDLTIKPRKMRGVASEGMICSLAELGLEKESPGIYIFDESKSLQVGSDARPWLGLDDVILDVTSTANRADALSMVGIAREIAAITGTSLRLPEAPVPDTQTNPALGISVETAPACPAYIGTLIEGVQVGPSPDWLQQRLHAAGMRPINNIVDITNYVLWEWGQPLHAFDRDRLQQETGSQTLTIGVRYAREGESLRTLDGEERALSSQNLAIVANDQPVALAGVMGGETTEVSDSTTHVFLEAALFDAVTVRRSARAAGLRTEASTRYERGVNQAELDHACQRALALMVELAGGRVTVQDRADSRGSVAHMTHTIPLRLSRVRDLLGCVRQEDGEVTELSRQEIERSLVALGCDAIAQGDTWQVTVPPYRARDLEREVDLIEEVARMVGYDRLVASLPKTAMAGDLGAEQQLTRQMRAAFRAAGLTELIHYSLVKPDHQNRVEIANPLLAEYSALRAEMLPALVDAFQYNWERGNRALHGFELGRIFYQQGDQLQEKNAIAGVMGGDPTQGRWIRSGQEQPLGWYEAKGILENACQRLGISWDYRPYDGSGYQVSLHPGRTASLHLRGQQAGVFGQLHPTLLAERGLTVPVYVFQLDGDVLLAALGADKHYAQRINRFEAYGTFPATERDLAFFVPVNVSVASLVQTMRKAGGKLLASVELFDEYRGENVPEGERSLAFRLLYRASDRTLTDEEVDPVQQKIRDRLTSQFGVTLRS
ncbi:phenylalanine--tRNA ligase subunit beta [Geitlerinema sp. PCC 9228]|uniref:phenylalanine--tRNA ligase subunit beta n=1 Tax=Geitlerinema sp. PCC 9228 TaxID=111611 RepID=UPI0008F99E67|nr:phenylalanine--tRNA ligase subunit beta [Geitlerinema sp. PCC 9228]